MCSCDDNVSEYAYPNEAKVHFYFAHRTENKTIEHALEAHNTKFEDYNLIFANQGNPPSMRSGPMLESARNIAAAGVPLIWLSTYDGGGDIRHFGTEDRQAFDAMGIKFLPVHNIVESLTNLTIGVVEHKNNSHFCMPGPPNEIGLLMLRIVWSHWLEVQPHDDRL